MALIQKGAGIKGFSVRYVLTYVCSSVLSQYVSGPGQRWPAWRGAHKANANTGENTYNFVAPESKISYDGRDNLTDRNPRILSGRKRRGTIRRTKIYLLELVKLLMYLVPRAGACLGKACRSRGAPHRLWASHLPSVGLCKRFLVF